MKGARSGADSYWPGFVDALTNVVIAMIFVVVVLALSLTFAAQIMAKKMLERAVKEFEVKATQESKVNNQAPESIKIDPQKKGGQALTTQQTTIKVEGDQDPPTSGGELRGNGSVIELGFEGSALTLNESATIQLKDALKKMHSVSLGREVEIIGRGPSISMSDNQRAAYIRVMSTRNILLESGYSASKITVRIDTETEVSSANVIVLFKD